MKGFLSFLVCLVVGLVLMSFPIFANQARGKSIKDVPVVVFSPFQEKAEFERDIGEITNAEITLEEQAVTYKDKIPLKSRHRKQPEIIPLN